MRRSQASKERDNIRARKIIKEGSAGRQAAGLGFASGDNRPSGDVAARFAEIPRHDERDLTGQVFGDPPPRDNRRAAWAPHLAGGA